jgi:hypothetical protein
MIIELLGGGGWLPSLWLPAPGVGRLCTALYWLVQHHHGLVSGHCVGSLIYSYT